MKIRTKDFTSGRTFDGRVYSAMAGTVTVVDDADEGMVTLMKQFAAAGAVEIIGEQPDTGPDTEVDGTAAETGSAQVSHTQYEDRTVVELRDLARERGLPTSGSKDDLVTRLREARP